MMFTVGLHPSPKNSQEKGERKFGLDLGLECGVTVNAAAARIDVHYRAGINEDFRLIR
jgi:hypothetical protein